MSGVGVIRVMDALDALVDLRLAEMRRRFSKDVAAGKKPHIDTTTKAERAEYLRFQLRDARDAVAELIAACGAEQMVINDYLLNPCKETWDVYRPAMMRRRAALARVKGDQA